MRKTKAIKKSSSSRRKSLRRKSSSRRKSLRSSKRTIGGASSLLSNFANMTNGLNKFVPQNNALNQLNKMNNVAQQAKTVMTPQYVQQQQPQYQQQQPQYQQQQPQYQQQQPLPQPQKQPTFSGLKNLATNLGFRKDSPASAPAPVQPFTLEQRVSNIEGMLNLNR